MSRLLRTQLKDSIKSYDITRLPGLLDQMDHEALNKKINKMPPLHWGCQKFHYDYRWMNYEEVRARAELTLDLLLAKPGIDVNAKSEGGFTPVHTAILYFNHPALEKLLACPGIDVNAKSIVNTRPYTRRVNRKT